MSLKDRYRYGELISQLLSSSKPDLWTNVNAHQKSLTTHLNSLSHNGFLPLNIPFSSSIVNEVSSLPSVGPGNLLGGNHRETEYLHNVAALPSVQRLINEFQLYALVSLYLGAPAYLYACEAWWQYPQGESHKPSNAQLWHRDRDDFNELKLFFYVSDVDSECGPHAFIPHSHHSSTLQLAFSNVQHPLVSGLTSSFIDDDVLDDLGLLVPPKVWLGAAGTCFLEDPRGYHRAYLPTTKPRLMLSLVWTVGPGFNH